MVKARTLWPGVESPPAPTGQGAEHPVYPCQSNCISSPDCHLLNDPSNKKTAPQYYFEDNVRSTIRNCVYNIERDCRTLAPILLQDVLLQKDGFILSQSDTNDELIKWEQRIVDESNEDVFKKGGKKRKTLELFHFVLETAWENDDEISLDEKHLIERIKERLRITDNEYRIIEATLGKFPNPGNRIHTLTEIETVRRDLQSKGLIFPMRDSDGTNFDVIPEELGETLRSV